MKSRNLTKKSNSIPFFSVFFFLIFFFSITNVSGQFKINSTGKAAINGEPNTYDELKVYGNISATGSIVSDANLGGTNLILTGIVSYTNSNNKLKFTGYYGGTPCIGIGKTPSSLFKLDVNGKIWCTLLYESSDKRFKKNIRSVSGQTMLEKIQLIDAKKYSYKNRSELLDLYSQGELSTRIDTFYVKEKKHGRDTLVKKTKIYTPNLPEGNRYGFLAQDVMAVFPEMVMMDSSDGSYAVNYNGFIPVLLEGVKELQAQIDSLKDELTIIGDCCANKDKGKLKSAEDNSMQLLNNAILSPNKPNPFNTETTIEYFLPSTISNATLYIYDLQGKQIKSINIVQRENGSETIYASELTPG